MIVAVLFELRPVSVDLFHKGGPDALNEPNSIRGHGQKPLRRFDTARKKCSCDPVTEPTIFKPLVPVKFVCARPQVVLPEMKVYWPSRPKNKTFAKRRLPKMARCMFRYWHKADMVRRALRMCAIGAGR